jgi:hypothetical protein
MQSTGSRICKCKRVHCWAMYDFSSRAVVGCPRKQDSKRRKAPITANQRQSRALGSATRRLRVAQSGTKVINLQWSQSSLLPLCASVSYRVPKFCKLSGLASNIHVAASASIFDVSGGEGVKCTRDQSFCMHERAVRKLAQRLLTIAKLIHKAGTSCHGCGKCRRKRTS